MTEPVIDLDSRRAPTPRHRLRVLLAVVVTLAIIAAGWMVWFSSLLTADTVRVVGVEGAAAQEVLAAAHVPLGLPLAQIDTVGIAAEVEPLSWLAEVEVRRGWPHDVVIAVTPRVAAAVQADGRAVDAEGVAFTPPTPVPPGLPKVRGTAVGLVSAMGVLDSMPTDLRRKVVSLQASTRDDVTLIMKSGARVRWGSVEQADLKAQVLTALLKRKAKRYDVSAPELPTTYHEKV